jgi:hypothetical protein
MQRRIWSMQQQNGFKSKDFSNPRGDNYDFSWFAEIIAVVCTPSVFYVPMGIATEFVADRLFRVSSVGELSEFVMS